MDTERKVPPGPWDYGGRRWCIRTALSENGEIFAYAESVEVTATGSLILHGNKTTNLILAAGQWTVIYAASCLDGSPVAVEYWKGEVHPHAYDPRID